MQFFSDFPFDPGITENLPIIYCDNSYTSIYFRIDQIYAKQAMAAYFLDTVLNLPWDRIRNRTQKKISLYSYRHLFQTKLNI